MRERLAFVTGATGFLGNHLAENLRIKGWRVIAIHRPGADVARLASWGVELRPGDISDPDSLLRAMPQDVDAVFHTAARVSFWSGDHAALYRDNAGGTRNMVEAALLRRARRFVYTSSVAVYGFRPGMRLDEGAPNQGLGSPIGYLGSKAEAEAAVKRGLERGLDAVILQPSNIMGRYDKKNWARVFRMIRDGKTPGAPSGRGSFVDGRAAARAHIAAAERAPSGSTYILSTTDASYLDLFKHAEKLMGMPPKLKQAPAGLLSAAAWVSQGISLVTRRAPDLTPTVAKILNGTTQYDGRKAIAGLGLESRSVQEMLADCHGWLKEEGMI